MGISFDSVEDNRAFAEKFEFPYLLLCDTDRAVGLAYGATEPGSTANAKRLSVLIDPEGEVKRVWPPKVDTYKHPQEVLDAVR